MSFTHTATFIVGSCCSCGCKFAMTDSMQNQRRGDHRWFYCPNGHKQHYSGESSEEQLRREKRQLEITLSGARDRADMHARSSSAYRGHLTRIKNRIGKGVCPCCNRTFADLARHMGSKHPDYAVQP